MTAADATAEAANATALEAATAADAADATAAEAAADASHLPLLQMSATLDSPVQPDRDGFLHPNNTNLMPSEQTDAAFGLPLIVTETGDAEPQRRNGALRKG